MSRGKPSPKSRGVLIAGNWKMNLGPSETQAFFSKLGEWAQARSAAELGLLSRETVRCALFPPMLSLTSASTAATRLPFPLSIGAQNVHWEKKGAFTGEISGPMLAECGLRWALVGHSERRQYFGETDETVRKRLESLLEQGITPILCIGETRAEREAGRTAQVIQTQLQGALPAPSQGAARFLDGRLIIAYEPVWAIGTGLTATPAQAEEAHQIVRQQLWDRFGMEAAGRTPVLYGGSVTPENIAELLSCPNVDGALVGGASVKPESYALLVQAALRACS